MSTEYREWYVRIPSFASITTYTGVVIENRGDKSIQIKVCTPKTDIYEEMRGATNEVK